MMLICSDHTSSRSLHTRLTRRDTNGNFKEIALAGELLARLRNVRVCNKCLKMLKKLKESFRKGCMRKGSMQWLQFRLLGLGFVDSNAKEWQIGCRPW